MTVMCSNIFFTLLVDLLHYQSIIKLPVDLLHYRSIYCITLDVVMLLDAIMDVDVTLTPAK